MLAMIFAPAFFISSMAFCVEKISRPRQASKLTITVKVHYENKIQPEKNFDRTYTDEATFSSDLDINSIETSQVKIVNDRIINKIFNDIVADW